MVSTVLEELTTLSVQVYGPDGVIELEDPDNGYSLHSDSFANPAYTHRTVEVNSPWVEGTYATDSILDNTTDALVVWVEGNVGDGTFSQYLFRTRLAALKRCFDQLSYQVVITIGDAIETWDCEVSDYTVETQQEYIFATRGVLRVPVPHRPTEGLAQVGSITPPPPPPPGNLWESIYLAETLGVDVPFTDRPSSSGPVLAGWPL